MAGRDPIVNPMQASVHRKLDEITRSLSETPAGTDAALAQRDTTLLVSALRTVLSEHRLDPRGNCVLCDSRRPRFLARRRRGRMPCRAYLAVQLALGPTIDDTAVATDTSRHLRRKKAGIAG